jgi:transposase
VAKRVCEITLGVDVSKDELVIYVWESGERLTLPNQPKAIKAWLKTLYGPVRLAIEPTSSYHLNMVEAAGALSHAVYLVNPRQLAHYREAVNERHKSDPEDAWLLARYLVHEAEQLRPYQLPCRQSQRLWALLKRRATVVAARKQVQQSLTEIQLSIQALLTQFERVLARIDRHIQILIRALGWSADYQRCLSIPGVGPLTAAALLTAYHRGAFASADAFIAFIGLDVRRRESGRYKGHRKLTKRGEAEIRRLLFCASQSAQHEPRFAEYYQRQLDKGLPKTAARIILGRKIARIAFTLISRQLSFK